MAMMSVVYWQPTGGLMAKADRLRPKVGSHLVPMLHLSHEPGEL